MHPACVTQLPSAPLDRIGFTDLAERLKEGPHHLVIILNP
jgi:hypothetical protein